jgi:transcriptional regulator with XRE-family HTH domain
MNKQTPPELVGNAIRQIRLKKEMKGETLARKLKKTKAAISQLENGLVDVKISYLFRIAEALEVPPDELLRTCLSSQGHLSVVAVETPQVFLSNAMQVMQRMIYLLEQVHEGMEGKAAGSNANPATPLDIPISSFRVPA